MILGIEDNLRDAVAIPQIHEDQSAQISAGVNPAFEDNSLSNVLSLEFAARVGTATVGIDLELGNGHGSRID